MNRRLQFMAGKQRPNARAQRLGEPSLLLDGLRSQCGGHQTQTLLKQVTQIELRLVPAERRDQGDSSLNRRCRDVPGKIGRANHIENDIGAAACGGLFHRQDKILSTVVNGTLGSQGNTRCALFVTGGSDDDTRNKFLWQFD